MSSRTLSSRATSNSRDGREEGGDYKTRARSPLPCSPRVSLPQNSHSSTRPSLDRRDGARTLSSSTSSSSASGSSFLDRMKIRSETSSRTSLEDDYGEPPKRGGGWTSTRGKRAALEAEEIFEEKDTQQDSTSGHGYDLWGHVTAVASNLTVNVSQAWQKSIHLADGEETPPGEDSRLTKAMKAYHLDRARTPTDLPAWLFGEHERGVAPRSWSVAKNREHEDRVQLDRDPEPRQKAGLRDKYDRASSSYSPALSGSRRMASGPGDGQGDGGSRAANRLKAIRDAKRSAVQRGSEPKDRPEPHPRGSDVGETARRSRGNTPGRVGLPAGPGRKRAVVT